MSTPVKLTGQWTEAERIRVAAFLLSGIQKDIYAGCYSVPGRPNITSVQEVLLEPAEALKPYTVEVQKMLDAAALEEGLDA